MKKYILHCSFITALTCLTNAQAGTNQCSNHKEIDHQDKWPAASIRNQGQIGSCHVFASTALVEAQYYLLTGKHKDLSERDLYYQHLFPRTDDSSLKNDILYFSKNNEGGWNEKDLNLFKQNGICSEETLPYDDLLRGDAEDLYDILKSDYNSKNQSMPSLINEFSLKGHSSCLKERIDIKEQFKNYQIENLSCGSDIKCTKEVILKYLECNPLAVSVSGYGAMMPKKWFQKLLYTPGASGNHALVIAGYDCKEDEFIMRNSWDGSDYDRIPADALINGLNSFAILHNGYLMPDEKYLRCPNDLITYIQGDINGDKNVDEKDTDEMYNYLWKYKIVENPLTYFKLDLNSNGLIDLADAKILSDLVFKVVPEYTLGFYPTGRVKKSYPLTELKLNPEQLKKGPWPKLLRRQRELNLSVINQLKQLQERVLESLNRNITTRRKKDIAMNYVDSLNNAYNIGAVAKNEFASLKSQFISNCRKMGLEEVSTLFSGTIDIQPFPGKEGRMYFQKKNNIYNEFK